MTQQSQESGHRYDGVDLLCAAVWGASIAIVLSIAVCHATLIARIGQATVTTPDITVTGNVVMRGDAMTVTSDGGTYTLREWSKIERVAPDGN